MKLLKILGIIAGVYIAFVVIFDGVFLGYLQPKAENFGLPMIVITTTDASGELNHRRVAGFEMDGNLYASAHHWTRGWFHNAMANPEVIVKSDDGVGDYVAVRITGQEFDRVAEAFYLSLPVRFAMGFPPKRDILRLDPVGPI